MRVSTVAGASRLLWPTLLLAAGLLPACAAAAMEPLHNAQPYHLHGKLEIEYRGWHRYLTVRLDHPVAIDFGPGEQAQSVSSIELNPLDKYDTVAAQAGGVVDAEGALRINSASSNYLNGVMLMAESVRLPDGALLHPAPSRQPSPPVVGAYMVTVTMQPKRFNWQRSAVDLETGRPLPGNAASSPASSPAIDGCVLNGPGDAMNCGCTGGFEPVRAGVVVAPLPVEDWGLLPRTRGVAENGYAQFRLTDPDARRPETIQVVCRAAAPESASKLP